MNNKTYLVIGGLAGLGLLLSRRGASEPAYDYGDTDLEDDGRLPTDVQRYAQSVANTYGATPQRVILQGAANKPDGTGGGTGNAPTGSGSGPAPTGGPITSSCLADITQDPNLQTRSNMSVFQRRLNIFLANSGLVQYEGWDELSVDGMCGSRTSSAYRAAAGYADEVGFPTRGYPSVWLDDFLIDQGWGLSTTEISAS